MILPELFSAADFREQQLLDPDIFLLDLRLSAQRAEMPSLSRAQEFSFATLSGELSRIPKDRYVLVICQFGLKAVPAAIYLREVESSNLALVQ
jgi:rhodanese-related sulfurtransferase